jgi:hypothetical protein
MNSGKLVFSQLMDFLPMHKLRKCIQRYGGNHRVRRFSCTDQFLCMAFAQLTYRDGLRDIESCLRAVQPKLYHMGIRGKVSRSTLAEANEKRDCRIYEDFANVLIQKAHQLYKDEDLGMELHDTVYALDSTTIDLCLSLFPWAKFRRHKGAIKLHTLLDLQGNIPSFILISDGKMHDVNVLDELALEPASFYVMDRGYLDYDRLHQFELAKSFFVTRSKENQKFRRLYSSPVDKSCGIRYDQIVLLTGYYSSKSYPDKLRRIRYFDQDTGRGFVFLTNNFLLPALTICRLYKLRWQVELFFKWIKQNLKIKSFYGLSLNAVKTQIWIAIAVYVLVAIMKKQLRLELSLHGMLQILSITLFEKENLREILLETNYQTMPSGIRQLELFPERLCIQTATNMALK